jgi:hypothetical protein
MGIGVVFADEKTNLPQKKDECLLISKNCQDQTLSIQEKIKRLQNEIQKGTRVYTPEELKRLEDKLKETETTLDLLLRY